MSEVTEYRLWTGKGLTEDFTDEHDLYNRIIELRAEYSEMDDKEFGGMVFHEEM